MPEKTGPPSPSAGGRSEESTHREAEERGADPMNRILLVFLLLLCCVCPCLPEDREPANLRVVVGAGGARAEAMRRDLRTYRQDGRKSIADLYAVQIELRDRHGWILEDVFTAEIATARGEKVLLPATCLRTPKKGPAFWLLTGIHGEEPAGPNAVAEHVRTLAALADKGVPVVLLPLCNPLGYYRNWRYPDAEKYSETRPGSSVGDSDHLLPDEKGGPRRAAPISPECAALTSKVLELSRDYPPRVSLDMHEDDRVARGYLYSQGRAGADDPVARDIVRIFLGHGFPIQLDGETRFGETIRGGIISGVRDGSIDELLGAPTVLVKGVRQEGPGAQSAIVLETSSMKTPLAQRVKVHGTVLEAAGSLWDSTGR